MEDLGNSCDEDGGAILDVECGKNKAKLYVARLCQGSKGSCILFRESWLTPNEFQYVSGRQTAKDWKRSIRHQGKSLKLLLSKGVVELHPNLCVSEGCRKTLPKRKTRMGTRRRAPLAENGELAESNRDESEGDDQNGDMEDDLKKTHDMASENGARSDIDTDEDTRAAIDYEGDNNSCRADTKKDSDNNRRRQSEMIAMQDTEDSSRHSSEDGASSVNGDESPSDAMDTSYVSDDDGVKSFACADPEAVTTPSPSSASCLKEKAEQGERCTESDENRGHRVVTSGTVDAGDIEKGELVDDENVNGNYHVVKNNIDNCAESNHDEEPESGEDKKLRSSDDVCIQADAPKRDDNPLTESKDSLRCANKRTDMADPTVSVISQNECEESISAEGKETPALNVPPKTKNEASETAVGSPGTTISCAFGCKAEMNNDHGAEEKSPMVPESEPDQVAPVKTYPAFVEGHDNESDSFHYISNHHVVSDVTPLPCKTAQLNTYDVTDSRDLKQDTIDTKKSKASADSNKNFLETRSVLAQSSKSTATRCEKLERPQPLTDSTLTPPNYINGGKDDNSLRYTDKHNIGKSLLNANPTPPSIKSADKKDSKRKCRLSAVIDSLRTSKEKALESSTISATPRGNDTAIVKHSVRENDHHRPPYMEVPHRRSLDVASLYKSNSDKSTPTSHKHQRSHSSTSVNVSAIKHASGHFSNPSSAQKLPASHGTSNKVKSTTHGSGVNPSRQHGVQSHRAKSARDSNKRSNSQEKGQGRIAQYAALPPRFPSIDNRSMEGSYLDLVQRYNMALAQQHFRELSSAYSSHLPIGGPYPFPNGASYEHLMLDPIMFYSQLMQHGASPFIPDPHASPSLPESSSQKRGVKRSSSQSNTSSHTATHNSKTSSQSAHSAPSSSSSSSQQHVTSRHSDDALDLSVKKRKTH